MCFSMMTGCFYLSMCKDIEQQQRISVTSAVVLTKCTKVSSFLCSSFRISAIYVKPDQSFFLFRGGVLSGSRGKQFTHSVYRLVNVMVISIMAVIQIQVVSVIVLREVVLGMHIVLLIAIIGLMLSLLPPWPLELCGQFMYSQ